ncbi:MAG TPA: hypothetical protein VGC30_04920 [Dokdonella sp.]
MSAAFRHAERSWFRSRAGRRFGLELVLIVGVKLLLLTALWLVCFRPYPRPDHDAVAVARHLLSPSPENANDR